MFGLFKKTSWKIEGKSLDFFRQIFSMLPTEFQFLTDGLNKGLYKRFSDVQELKSGIYFIQVIEQQTKAIQYGKFVKAN